MDAKKYHFLQGGGEMGELTRSFDWAKTSIGAPDQWPQSLRTTVSTVLSSRFPMFIWWGDELIQFYNDAYRPSLGNGGKHPRALGQKGEECWPEIWDIIHPLIQQVQTTGEATWSEDQLIPIYRNGKIEDVYWTFSYSPIWGESDKADGVLVVCTETTEKVNNLKKLAQSEQRFRNLIAESTVAITLLTGNDLLIELANDAILKLWHRDASIIGKPLTEAMPELKDQRYLEILRHILLTGEAVSEEAALVKIEKNGKLESVYRDFSYKPLRNENGEITSVLAMVVDVTENVVAQQRLMQSEARYRTLIEEGAVATALYTGPEMRIQYVNETMLKYWGKDESVIGKTFREALPELGNQPFPALLEDVFATGESYVGTEEKAFLEVNGKLQPGYYNFTYKALRRDDGTVYGVHHFAIDVTEQVIARKQVEEGEQKVRAIVESAPFPIAVYTGREMRVELANQAIMDIWGKGNDVIGKLFTEVLPELGNQEVFEQIATVFESGKSLHKRGQRLDLVVNGKSRPYWFNYSFTPLFDSAGEVYGVMNTGVDNTDLMLAKLKVEENEKNMRNTILKAPVAMCIFRGPQHVVEIANERMIELWGKTADDVMNKPIFAGVPEVKNQGFEQLLDGVFTTGETFAAEGVPVTLPRNGKIEQAYVNFVYAAFYEADGQISGVIAVATDVTSQVIARQKIEEVVSERTKELAEANSNLQRSNAELAQFAYIASHDLQEPVRKVSTFAQMLEQSLGNGVDERATRYLSKINTASSRMTTLIRDVLSYSQLSREKEVFEAVDLRDIVQNIESDFELLIEQKQAKIDYGDLPVVEAIPLQMSQLFGNLISNSLKFSRPGVPPHLRISTAIVTKEDAGGNSVSNGATRYYKITLRDNGIGFDQEHAAQIFNIFQRLHGKSEYAGTGIGLAMCKKIVQNHKGDIYAEGSVNDGAVFNVILPVSAGS